MNLSHLSQFNLSHFSYFLEIVLTVTHKSMLFKSVQ